jgi:hypothetical protein
VCKWCNYTGVCLPRSSPDCKPLKVENDEDHRCSGYSNNEDLCVQNLCGWCVIDKDNQECISIKKSESTRNCLYFKKVNLDRI